MTPEELQILRALLAEYERLCDQFCIRPGRHPAYVAAKNLSEPKEEE